MSCLIIGVLFCAQSWQADKYISDDRFKLYVLLSGTMVWENATQLTNCCVDLDWKRALAIHYWYSPAKVDVCFEPQPTQVIRYH